jgi:putative ABC transport system permease protein
MGNALNFDADRVVLITVDQDKGQDPEFKRQILATPGVEGAAYSRYVPVYRNIRPAWFTAPSRQVVQFTRESVDADFFRLFGVKVLAGRGLSSVYSGLEAPEEVVINRTALNAFGYKTPQDAVGRSITYTADGHQVTSSIVGVVNDMRTATIRDPVAPMVFDGQSKFFTILSVRIAQTNQQRSLAAIDGLWRQNFPQTGPMERRFFSEYLHEQYQDMHQQWRVFGLLSFVGICLNVLGLSGLSIYLARARLREMAIRNALGARLVDIFRLRMQPFVKPLIVANLAAALISWLAMSWWLSSFEARVDLSLLSFIGAGGLTVFITLLTLITHVLLSSPARSSQPLRTD